MLKLQREAREKARLFEKSMRKTAEPGSPIWDSEGQRKPSAIELQLS